MVRVTALTSPLLLGFDDLERALEHMGDHIATLRAPPADGDLQPYIIEDNAWVITAVAAAMAGQKTLTLPGGYLLWNSAWPAADRTKLVDEGITSFLGDWAALKK